MMTMISEHQKREEESTRQADYGGDGETGMNV